MSGTGKIISGLSTSIYEVNSKVTYYVKGVPFDASINVANKLMEALEPFDYSEMVRFESRYLQGFYADKYDQLPTEMTERIMRRIHRFSRSDIDLVSRKYTEYEDRYDKALTWLNEINVKYCLLPVWFMTMEFDGSEYQFGVNGQTGEASGQVPTSSLADLGDKVAVRLESLSPRPSHKKRKSAYETNDYDKDPGLDCYFDSTRHSDLKVDEILLRHVVKITDKNGNIIGEHSVEL